MHIKQKKECLQFNIAQQSQMKQNQCFFLLHCVPSPYEFLCSDINLSFDWMIACASVCPSYPSFFAFFHFIHRNEMSMCTWANCVCLIFHLISSATLNCFFFCFLSLPALRFNVRRLSWARRWKIIQSVYIVPI